MLFFLLVAILSIPVNLEMRLASIMTPGVFNVFWFWLLMSSMMPSETYKDVLMGVFHNNDLANVQNFLSLVLPLPVAQ